MNVKIEPKSAPDSLIKIEPQPILGTNGWWWLDDQNLPADSMKSHLFHEVWGGGLDNSGVDDTTHSVDPIIVNINGVDVWYWMPVPL